MLRRVCVNVQSPQSINTSSKDINEGPGLEIIKRVSCSTQLSIEFELIITSEMLKNKDFSFFQTLRCCTQVIMLINVKMLTKKFFHD